MSGIIENVWAMQNELRNKEGITGIDAMHHVLMVLLAKSFTKEQCHKLNIPEEFAFNNMIKLNKTDLFNKFYNPSNSRNCVVRYLRDGDVFGYNKNFPFQIKNESTLEFMYSRVNQIDHNELMNKLDIVGDIYEHFINREGKTMKDLGQYFTDRSLIRYLVQSINPNVHPNGQVPTLWDPASGTGGFLIEYIHQLNELGENINWSLNKNNIFANDINKNTYTLLKQNLYYAFKESSGISIKLLDSLCNDDDLKYDNILANPPFGIKGLKYKDMNQKIKNLGINGTKGEILFIQLCMAKLNDNGKCCIVVPEGVLFNSTKMYKETRKYLLENFNLTKIIKVGDGEFFKNTGVKTSVLCFEKTGSTQNIDFIQVDKVNDSIQEVPLMSINIDKIIENDYSLNMNLYKEIVLNVNGDFEVVELSDLIIRFESGKYIENTSGTLYPYYNSNGITGYLDTFMLDGEYIIQASSGNINKNIFFHNGKLNHTNFTTAFTTNNRCITKYIYYYIKLNLNLLENCSNQSTIPNLDKKSFVKSKIILPPLEVQNSIVEQLDNIYENEINTSKEIINGLKKSIETIMKNTMYRDDLQEFKIKDVFTFSKGKISAGKAIHGIYEFISLDNKKVDNYCCDGENIFISTTPCGNGKVKIKYYNGKCNYSSLMCKLEFKINVNIKYFYIFLKQLEKFIKDEYLIGACNKHIDIDGFNNYKIHIPPIEVQREILSKIEPKEKLIEGLEKNITCAENEAKDIMSILFNQNINDVADEPEPEQ